MMFSDLFFIFLGGGIGSVIRYLITILGEKSMYYFFDKPHPLGTFFVNIVGSFAIGLLYGYFQENINVSESLKLFLLVGFLGGFTTFSSFSLDTFKLVQSGETVIAVLYISTSIILALSFTYFGIKMTSNL